MRTRWLAVAVMVLTLMPVTAGLSAPIDGYQITETFPGFYGAVQTAPNGTLVLQQSPGVFSVREPDGTLTPVDDGIAEGDTYVTGVNSSGQVVGYTDTYDDYGTWTERRTWVWALDGSVTYLPFLEGGTYLNGDAISEMGWVAGIAFDGSGKIRTFVWDPVGGTRSMADSGDPGWTFVVDGMFADNRVYGTGLQNGDRSLYVWDEAGGLQFIGNLGGSFLRATAGDVSGVIAGFATNAVGEYQAWLWSDSTPLTAISPALATSSFVPWSVTSDLVVGGPTKVDGADRGAIWTPANGYEIRHVDGSVVSRVVDVRSDGSALGYVFDFTNGRRGGIWQPDGTFEFLPDAYLVQRFLPSGQIVGSQESTRYPAIWTPLDADGDGVLDSIDPDGGAGTAPDGAFADATTNTTGELVATIGDGDLTVLDEPDPDGVRVIVSGSDGSGVQIQVCGFTMTLFAGTEAVFTCGSVIIDLISGSAVLTSEDGLFSASLEAPVEAVIDEAGGEWSVSVSSGDVVVTVDGQQQTIGKGDTAVFTAWDFDGFFDPVDNDGVVNSVRAGQVVPLAWSLTDGDGPVTDLSEATLAWVTMPCDSEQGSNPVEQQAAGESGLQHLGDGVYQINWKTPRAYAGSCGALQLDIGDGLTHEALFALR